MDNTDWFRELRALPPEQEIPGTDATVAEWLDLHDRRPDPPGYTFDLDVAYGTTPDGRELKLHVYRPQDPSTRRPGVVFVHGGGWAGGHPVMHLRHAVELAHAGFVTALITYRFSGEAPFPAAIEDAKCAVRWMRANASDLGVDPDRITVAGGSAGGHIAAMVALTPGRFEGKGGWPDAPSDVQAAVLWYPMTDMTAPGAAPHARHLVAAFLSDEPVPLEQVEDAPAPSDERVAEASPLTYVHGGAPPILSMTGDLDKTTPADMIRTFHAALDRCGAPNRLEVFVGRDHAFDLLPRDWHASFELLRGWLEQHVGTSRDV